MGARLAVDLILILGVLIFPWWLVFSLLIFSLIYFSRFYEGVYFAYLLDLFYAFGTFYFMAGALGLFLLADYLRKNFRPYGHLQIK